MVEALVGVLRRQWQRVLRLLLKIVLTALESSLAKADEEDTSDSRAREGTTEST
jgi:hypothetical protein